MTCPTSKIEEDDYHLLQMLAKEIKILYLQRLKFLRLEMETDPSPIWSSIRDRLVVLGELP